MKQPAARAAAARRWLSAANSSWSAREMWKSAATFSAVTPMWTLSNGSDSAPVKASMAVPSPIRSPQRMPGSQYGARLIDSAPPATATSQSPSMTACEADTMACSPLPHSRFTVSAGRPDRQAAVNGRHPGQVHVPKLGMEHVAEHHVTHLSRVHTRPADRLTQHLRSQITGRDRSQATAELADRSPDTRQDEYVFHFSSSSSPVVPDRR